MGLSAWYLPIWQQIKKGQKNEAFSMELEANNFKIKLVGYVNYWNRLYFMVG